MHKMGDSSAATSGLKISDAKASIIEELTRMRKWQNGQRQEFRNKQLMEHQKLLLETEKNFEKYYGHNKGSTETFPEMSASSITDQSQSGSEVSFQDKTSSINGHILNCFSDSSHDSTTLYRSKDNADIPVASVSNGGYSSLSDISSQNSHSREHYMNEDINTAIPNQPAPKRPVRPFLRKRAGLERYKLKKRTNPIEGPKPTIEQKTDFPQRKVILKLKPALHTSTSPPRKTNHVKFCEPIQVFDHEVTNPKQLFYQSNENSDSQSSQHEVEESESENFSTAESQELEDKSISSDTSLNTESKELAEFEMLENCAQNSSFNSDSSVVQRVLNGETLKPFQNPPPNFHSRVQNSNYIRSEERMSENTVNFTNLKDLDSRKQRLQDFISNFEPKIASLQKEVTNSNRCSFDEYDSDVNKRCSTPVEDTATLSDCNSSKNSSTNSIIFVPQNEIENDQHNETSDASADNMVKYKIARDFSDKKDEIVDSTKQNEDFNRGQIDKSKLREKMEELEKEIQNYQAERSHLATISKERDVILKQLKKERDEFQKNKEEEINKFYYEIESQKQQFKREKETFNRLKKVTKDHRNRKEREDLSTLKQEVEKLQKELKKERIKFNNETRKLKNQLTAAERERDNFKLQNITLEDQIEDLVAVLKVKIALEEKAESKTQTKGHSKTEKRNNASNGRKEYFDNQDNRISSDTSDNFKEVYVNVQQDNIGDSNITQPKVRFNLAPQFNENIQSGFLSDSGIGSSNEKPIESNRSLDNDFMTKSTVDSCFEKPPYEEIQHDDKKERIYNTGEVEIFFPSGTRKHVSADGETIKFFYSNGDEKEIFPDKRTIYRFVNGDVEKRFPSGSVITEFVNGQIQKQNSDGSKEVTFPDGSNHFIYCDGRLDIINKDGNIARVDLDGTETIEFKNGEKEIRKDGYKRREYPDGSIKIIYKSGRQETRYASGRIRIKDKDGKLVLDTKHLKDLAGKFE